MIGLVGALGVLAAGRADAQSYTLTTSSGTLSSIQSTGTLLSVTNSDDGSAPISPGFSVPFFGSYATTVYATTNGLLVMDTDDVSYSNTTIPSSSTPNGFIAAMWDDLAVPTGVTAGIYYAVQGSSGNRVLVVEWLNIAPLSYATETLNMQVRIYEASGNIEIYYGSRASSTLDWGATIGVEDAAGSYGVAATCATPAACTPADVPQGTKLVFTPSSTPPPTSVDLVVPYVETPSSPVSGGQALSLSYEVDNYGTSTSPSTDLAIYASVSSNVTTSDLFIGSVTVPQITAGSYSTGYISATIPSGVSGTYYVKAFVDPFGAVVETDESNNSYSLGAITVSGGTGTTISVLTESLPEGSVGASYSVQLQQSGATSPAWSVISGALPSGLTLSTTGRISGTPVAEGSASFVVQAAQSGYTAGVAELSITIRGGSTGGPTITTTSLPVATVNVPYTAMLSATGGTPPYGFQIISERPGWLRLTSQGAFSGTPDAEGSIDLVVSVFDSQSQNSNATVHLEVVRPTALAIVESLPSAVVGQPYDAPVVSGGQPPYTITFTSGQLPNGLQVDGARGAITGTPTAAGTTMLGVSVTDGTNATVTGNLSLVAVVRSTLTIRPGDLVVYTNSNVMLPLTASGGVEPYTWSIVSGALQEGLSLDAGRIVGRVTRVSTATVTFGVTDSMGEHAEATLHVKAQVYRAGGSRGGSSERDSGCTCVVPAAPKTAAPVAVIALGLVGIFVARRRAPRAGRVEASRGEPQGDRSPT